MTIIYTDGSCMPNPGPGGWAFVIIDKNNEIWKVSGGEEKSTNNRMELTAVIEALKFTNEKKVEIRSDSMWVINCAQRLWKRKMNLDLWGEYDKASQNIQIVWTKVKAHSGNKYNDVVDRMAKDEIKRN